MTVIDDDAKHEMKLRLFKGHALESMSVAMGCAFCFCLYRSKQKACRAMLLCQVVTNNIYFKQLRKERKRNIRMFSFHCVLYSVCAILFLEVI